MTTPSAKFTIRAGQHSPTTGSFTCQVFFPERQDHKVLAASRLRTEQVIFCCQSNNISFYSKLQCLNELFQLLRSSLHAMDFKLSQHNFPKIDSSSYWIY